MDPVSIGNVVFEPRRAPLLVAGPCVLESEEDALRIALHCAELARRHGFVYVFKASYLKDNRSSIDSYAGPGLERGLPMLARVKEEAGVPVLTDVHCRDEVEATAAVADVLQIPAFLARQTRLILTAAAADILHGTFEVAFHVGASVVGGNFRVPAPAAVDCQDIVSLAGEVDAEFQEAHGLIGAVGLAARHDDDAGFTAAGNVPGVQLDIVHRAGKGDVFILCAEVRRGLPGFAPVGTGKPVGYQYRGEDVHHDKHTDNDEDSHQEISHIGPFLLHLATSIRQNGEFENHAREENGTRYG